MEDLRIFENPSFGSVRTLEKDGEPWFIGKDVAVILGYSNPQKAIRDHVDEEDKGVNETFTPGGSQNVICINESGVYSLVFASKLPMAKVFKRWVTDEVIPSIRKHGAYMTPDKLTETLTRPESVIELLQALVNEQTRVKELTSTNAALTAEVNTWEPRMVLNRLARAYAGKKYGGITGAGWKVFYDRLLYKGHINLESRRTRANGKARPLLDFIHPDEWPQAVKIMTALCEEAGINTGKLLTSENKKTIK